MNFRSSYYEKVGCKSVEEKKSLEILLRENPVNRSKLKQFCLRFSVPAFFREPIWCFVLEIYPVYFDYSKEYVLHQRKSSYHDLTNALRVMRYIDDKTPKSKVFYAMYLLENRATLLSNLPDCTFVKISEALLGVLEEKNPETYFLTKKFYNFALEIENELPKFVKITSELLEKNDKELHGHFIANDLLAKIPFDRYYPTMFSGIIADTALIRIFDRIVGGGSLKIVIFLFLVICDVQRLNILSKTSEKSVIKIIESIYNPEEKSVEKSDLVVNKAIDMWPANKNHKDFPSKYKSAD